jgi:formate--tetrahydrofolate ligase
VIGEKADGTAITCGDLQVAGAMAALLRDAIRPNLVQTIEGCPAFVHGGPFGNIAHGCSSLIATRVALGLGDFVVTEGGFGSDLGGEKFLNILTRSLGFGPDAIVLVATVRALKFHGGGDLLVGLSNLRQHIKHLQHYGPPVIVTVNRFADDTPEDHQAIVDFVAEMGLKAVVSDPWLDGGEGCRELGVLAAEATSTPTSFEHMYELSDTVEEKLAKLATGVYSAAGFRLTTKAKKSLAWIEKAGYGQLPVCVAKTQSSLSDNPKFIGAPHDFTMTVKDIRLSAGAGFLVVICGDIMLMPGMGAHPAAFKIDVDENGVISGLN